MPFSPLIAFVAGATMPLAFAPLRLWPVVVLAPAVLLFQHLRATSAGQSFRLGWLFGLGYFGFGVYWLYNSLHIYGKAPAALAGALTLLMIVTLALFVGAGLYLHHRLRKSYSGNLLLWSLPLLWFCLEWFKGWVLTGFPWLSVGYAHVDSPLAGFAPLIGVYGIGLLSIAMSLALVLAVERRCPAYLGVILVPLAGGWLLQQWEWTRDDGNALDITLIQGNIEQDRKWRMEERPRIIQTYWRASDAHWGSDLVVWPEVAIPGRTDQFDDILLKPMDKAISERNSNLLTGILVTDVARDIYFNSMIMLGDNEGEYHKRHLVPFGEFYPFRSLLSFMRHYIRIPMSDMQPGPDEQALMQVKGVRLGVSICYEDVFSRDINLDLPAANILVNTSNDAWFGDSLAPHQHLQIAQMRALETERPLVRSTNTGPSAFIDHKGGILSATDTFVEQALTARIQGRSGSTPFLYFARFQPWLAWLILLAALWFVWRSRRAL